MRTPKWLATIAACVLALSQLAGCIAPISSNWGSQLAGAALSQSADPWLHRGPGGVVFTSLAVGSDGVAWATDNTDKVWYSDGYGGWWQTFMVMRQVAVGSPGTVFGLDAAGVLFKYDGNDFVRFPIGGRLKQVDVGCDNDLWGVTAADVIAHHTASGWQPVAYADFDGYLTTVAVGDASNVWGRNINRQIGLIEGGRWRVITTANSVAAGCDGTTFLVLEDGAIRRILNSRYVKVPGSLDAVAVGSASQVWGLKAGKIYQWDPNRPLPTENTIPTPTPVPPAPPTPKPTVYICPADTAKSSGLSACEESVILQKHNAERQAVGVANMNWSPEIAAKAKVWANYLVTQTNIETLGNGVHSTTQYRKDNNPLAPGEQMGENIAGGKYSSNFVNGLGTGFQVVFWAQEKPNYNYQSNSCQAGTVCGHYTQLVWRNTQYVGCGYARGSNQQGIDQDVLVCQYYAVGNVAGQKPY